MDQRPLAPHRWYAKDIDDEARAGLVFAYVRAIENRQEEVRLQMFRNAYLYTGEELSGINVDWERRAGRSIDTPRINIVGSVIETARARVASREPRIAVTTRGGDWDLRTQAKGMEQYLDGKLHNIAFAREWGRSFGDCAALGIGLTKVARWHDEIIAERTFPTEVVVDEAASHTSPPLAMFQRRFPDVDELAAEYEDEPDKVDAIWRAASAQTESWCDYITYNPYHVPVIEAWRKPLRPGGEGLHLVCVKDKVLFSEPWKHDYFPFCEVRWLEKLTGWYGIGIPEIVYFLQARLNRHAAYEAACQNRALGPIVLVDIADAALGESVTNDLFTVVPWQGRERPQVVTPPQVPPETYQDEDRKIQQIYQVSGMSEFATGARSRPPTGLDSQPALAEWIDYTEGRFARQEKGYDNGWTTACDIVIDITRGLGSKAGKATWHSPRYGLMEVEWSKVDMKRDQYRLRIMPASSTSQTPAGLRQRLEEERAAGRMADDLYRYFVQTLDVEAYYNLYDAAVSNLMRTIALLEDASAEFPAPSEYQALELGLWLVQMELNKIQALGAPDKILRRFSAWMEQAEYLVKQGKGAPAGTAPQLGPGQAGGGQQAPQLANLGTIPVPGAA